MRPRYITFIPGLFLCILPMNGQDTWYGSVSGMQVMYNPAWTGAAGAPVLNISAY